MTPFQGESAEYTFTVSPWQRGTSSGILAFVVDDMEKARNFYKEDSDSDDEGERFILANKRAKSPRGKTSREKDTPAYLKPQKSLDAGLSSYRLDNVTLTLTWRNLLLAIMLGLRISFKTMMFTCRNLKRLETV